MGRPFLKPFASFVSRASEWLVLLFLLLAATPPILVRHRWLVPIPKLDLLDGSWLLDTSYKAAGGIWFGRDVAFTYGPLFQWLSSVPSRWIGISTGSVYATWYTLPFYLIVVATFLTTRLLLPESPGWRRALLVLLAVVYWSPLDLRVSLCLLAFAIFVRLTDAAATPGASIPLRALVAALVCVVAFLFSSDTGIYSVAALLLCAGATAVGERRSREMTKFCVAAAAAFGVLILAINAVMFSPFDFRFWRSSLAISNGYRWFEPIAMAKTDKHAIFATLALGTATFALAAVWPKLRRNWTARPGFLPAGFCLGIVMMQSALVRSDHGHVLVGIYATIFLCGAIVLDRLNSGTASAAVSAVLLVAVTLVVATPHPLFLPANVVNQVKQFGNPALACPEGLHLLDQACLSPEDTQSITAVTSFVDTRTKPEDRIAIFPYETAFGLFSRRQVAGGVMQSYLANGAYLSGLEIAGLQTVRPSVALYFPDGVISLVLDGVPNLTRNPDLWFYYLRHYQAVARPAVGEVGLLRDDSREGRVRLTLHEIGEPPGGVAIDKRSTTIDLGQLIWPSAGADFLKLRLRVDYAVWWRMRKPSCYTLRMSFADGSQKSIQFILRPDQASDIWVYPWQEEDLGRYFAADKNQWRAPNRPTPIKLELLVTPFDWISVVPTRVTVESIEAVRVDLQ